MSGCQRSLHPMFKIGKRERYMTHMKDKANSTLPPFSATYQTPMKSRRLSFIQTCERSVIGPIIVTSSSPYGRVGGPVLKEWSETQSVPRRRRSNVVPVHSVNSKEVRVSFEEGHICDYRMWEYANEDLEQDLFIEI
jgi:hypothetical protein